VTQQEWCERWRAAERELERHAATVDRLNVFPVADRDTGHNMLATLHAGVSRLKETAGGPRDHARVLVEGAIRMARGNSGVILSQWLRGFLDAAPASGPWDVEHWRGALQLGARYAREHLSQPVEGTILTVADAAARGSLFPSAETAFWAAVLEAAGSALRHTPDALAVLAEAGVVDAGGQGLVLILEGLAGTGVPPAGGAPVSDVRRPAAAPANLLFPYDVEALVLDPAFSAGVVTERLSALGDSVALSFADPRELKVHVHTDRPHEVVRLLEESGRLRELTLLDMRAQVEAGSGGPWPVVEEAWADLFRAAGFTPLAPGDEADRPGALWLQPQRVLKQAVAVHSPGALLVALDHWWEAADVRAEARVLERAAGVEQILVESGGDRCRVASLGVEGSVEDVLKAVSARLTGDGLVHCYIHADATEEEVRLWETVLGVEARPVASLPVWGIIVRE
jgi:hypothetical protein